MPFSHTETKCFSYWRFADHPQQLKGASMSKRVAFYVRVSTDGQTVENQLGELHAVADRHGWQVTQIYADRGISGTKGREGRPEFDKLLKAIARREVDMVAAWSVVRPLGP